MMPDCPKCGADGRHVEIVVVVIWSDGRQREDFACNCCGHPWSLIEPTAPDVRGSKSPDAPAS